MRDKQRSSGVILTGGESRRMGRDKLTLQVGDQTILARARETVAAACGETILVGEGGDGGGARRVPDLRPEKAGPLAGIEAGLAAARYPLVFVAAGDMPFLSVALIEHLLARLKPPTLAAVPFHGGRPHPLCAAYHRDLLPEVSAALDHRVRAVREFLAGLESVEYVEELGGFGDPDLMLMNVNAPEDLERARALVAGESR